MPVHLDTHDPEIDLTPGTTKSEIVGFLYSHSEYGYKPAEIRDQLSIPHGTATTTLTRLHEDGFIGKTQDGYYHALENREDLRRYASSLDQLDRMFQEPSDETATPGSKGGDAATTDASELEDELEPVDTTPVPSQQHSDAADQTGAARASQPLPQPAIPRREWLYDHVTVGYWAGETVIDVDTGNDITDELP